MNDDEILDLFALRSESAIIRTREKYGRYCTKIIYSILGNREETEECENDVYLKLWKTVPPYRPDSLISFLTEISRNSAISVYRKKKAARRGGGQIDSALSELAECVDMNSDVEKENERKLLSEAVNEFLSVLPKEKRIVFVQRYWYMLSLKEIADFLGVGESKIKVMLHRTRKELKSYLKEKELY